MAILKASQVIFSVLFSFFTFFPRMLNLHIEMVIDYSIQQLAASKRRNF